MSLKAKLVTSISAFALVLALLIVGVFAVNSATVNMSGSISFNATDANVTIDGALTGAATSHTFTQIVYDATHGETENATAKATWTGIVVDFKNEASNDVTLKITVTNKDATRPMYAALSSDSLSALTAETNNVTATVSDAEGKYTWGESVEIPAGGTKTAVFTITFHMDDRNEAVNVASWNAGLQVSSSPIGG